MDVSNVIRVLGIGFLSHPEVLIAHVVLKVEVLVLVVSNVVVADLELRKMESKSQTTPVTRVLKDNSQKLEQRLVCIVLLGIHKT